MKNYIEEVALTGVDNQERTLSPERGYEIALAYLTWLCHHTGLPPEKLTISVGQDPRLSGRLLKISFFDALVPRGVTCLDLGLASDPAVRWMMENNEKIPGLSNLCQGSVLVTSSKGESHINGFKFYGPSGLLDGAEVSNILHHAAAQSGRFLFPDTPFQERCATPFGKKVYHTTEFEVTEAYSNFLRTKWTALLQPFTHSGLPLNGLKISIDASNGTGGFLARKVLAPLGADISGSQYLDPDGNFFNHPPDAGNKGARQALSMKVLTSSSHLGLLLNCDVSGFTAFDGKGFEIHSPEEVEPLEPWLERILIQLVQ